MVFASWRGVVGVVKPTHRPGSLEEFIRLLPEGIGVVPVYLNFKRGTEDEFRAALNAVEEKVAELAQEGVDLIHPEGAPPFMVHGYKGEEKIIKEWEAKYKIPMVTAAQTQVEALRALKVKKFVGVTYFINSVNDITTRYFPRRRLRCSRHGRNLRGLRRRRTDCIAGNLRAHAESLPKKSKRRGDLYARHGLALPRHHPFARGRFASSRHSPCSRARLVDPKAAACKTNRERLWQIARRDDLKCLEVMDITRLSIHPTILSFRGPQQAAG